MAIRNVPDIPTTTENYFRAIFLSEHRQPTINIKSNVVDPSVSTVVNNVHRRLRPSKPSVPKIHIPVIPTASVDTQSQLIPMEPEVITVAPVALQNVASEINVSGNVNGFKSKFRNAAKSRSLNTKALTIPKMKVLCERKHQQHMHRFNPFGCNYTNHQRVREVLRQKNILEQMLAEHEKLQHDRQAIAYEIKEMRGYLNDIRSKLDYSLKKLNAKFTIVERMPQFRRSTEARIAGIENARNRNYVPSK